MRSNYLHFLPWLSAIQVPQGAVQASVRSHSRQVEARRPDSTINIPRIMMIYFLVMRSRIIFPSLFITAVLSVNLNEVHLSHSKFKFMNSSLD